MPELPDIMVYVDALERTVVGHHANKIIVRSPFVVRSFQPAIEAVENRAVRAVRRVGKRLIFEFEEDLFLVLHLMIAGRLRWKEVGAKPRQKIDLAALQFDHGTLVLIEPGTKHRASIHLVEGAHGLAVHNRGGLDVLTCDLDAFKNALKRENHTVKRTLTDPTVFDGIGNAYSDEILHTAKLSPLKWTQKLSNEEIERLFDAARESLATWIEKLRQEFADRFPNKPGDITAFRKDFAVHGKFGEPCPVCHSPVQRIVYSENETNYCATCQTNGKVLADRSLSRLLKDDWPRSIEEWE